MKKIFLLISLVAVFCLLVVKPVSAQVNYEDVVEKIHFTDPERRGGPDNHLLEAVKEIGSANPVLRAYVYGDLNGQIQV